MIYCSDLSIYYVYFLHNRNDFKTIKIYYHTLKKIADAVLEECLDRNDKIMEGRENPWPIFDHNELFFLLEDKV